MVVGLTRHQMLYFLSHRPYTGDLPHFEDGALGRGDGSRGGRCRIKWYDGCWIATKEGGKREEKMEIEDRESSNEGMLD